MHLLSITNFDYGIMTALFCLILGVTYLFRRRNPHSDDFLLMKCHTVHPLFSFLSLSGVGLIEFIALSSYGAYAGIPALCLLLPLFLLCAWLYDYRSSRSAGLLSLSRAASEQRGSAFFLVAYSVFMLLVAAVAISIVVTMFKSLLGWEFGNSTLSLLGVITVCLIIGGLIALNYNHVLAALISSLCLALVLMLGLHQLAPSGLLANLQQAALSNHLASTSFTSLTLNAAKYQEAWLLLLAVFALLVSNPLHLIKRTKLVANSTVFSFSTRCYQLLILLMMVAIGVVALATPGQQNVIDGKKIVTQQTRLADGSLGYIVRAVPSDQQIAQRGIIPQQQDDSEQLSSADSPQTSFDYLSSAMVMIKHVFPYAFVSLLILVLLFFKSVTEALSFATIALIRGLYAPRYNKSGEDLENLWAARVCIFMLVAVVIALGLLLYKFLSIYYMLSLILLLAIPLVANVLGVSRSWLIDGLVYVLTAVWLCVVDVPNVPSLLSVVKYPNLTSLLVCISLTSVGIYLLTFVFGWFFVKKVVHA